ncbi:class I SAM-dependent methyltransferase [Streptomyces bambusae]|uniref:Methyltransferase domain-containing protein n=1 Tax=Streptomyces bambusae TaxID=1550616 RepID=A0ABS6ZGA3_9ACTN|nr:class I SAM-dependent methyltransferase [Streptomyces bambusae]MBW5486775.1 methyltransferase domain-containing protein [Streptomyces bambusae]
MTELNAAAEADRALKAKHRTMWSLGDYPAVATQVVSGLGPELVRACGVRRGDRVLDVAAGSGNAAIPAALTGADVIASDLTPVLMEAGKALAAQQGAELAWEEADAEALPFEDGEFDVVMSCVGVMFAPNHQACADELVRVCRDGGTVGLVNWTPQGFIGRMFTVMKPYAPPPPPGAQPPPLWGDEEHVAALLGDRVTDIDARRQTLRVDRFGTPEEFRDFFKAAYGPTIAVYKNIADDPGKVAALDDELAALAREHMAGGGGMEWEYLLFTAHRRVS